MALCLNILWVWGAESGCSHLACNPRFLSGSLLPRDKSTHRLGQLVAEHALLDAGPAEHPD